MSDAKRQQRTILITTAAAVAVVSVLATLAVVLARKNADQAERLLDAEQRIAELGQEAKTASDRATRARSQASQLVSFFAEGLREELNAIGKSDLLESAALRAESYFEALPPGDIDAHSDVSHAKMLILRGWAQHNQGALPESIAAFEKAVQLLAPHAEAADADPQMVYRYLQALNEWTLPLHQAGEFDKVDAVLTRALGLADKLLAGEPDHQSWLHSRAASLFGLGTLATDTGEQEAAVTHFDGAIAAIQRALELVPDDTNYLALEMICNTSKGQALVRAENYPGAEAATEAGAAIAEKLIEMQPARKKWRKEYATALNNFGSMLTDQGEIERAQAFLDRSRGMRKELIAFDPANASWRTDLANSESNLATQHLADGKLPAAAAAAAECVDHWAIILKTDPDNPDWHDRLRSSIKNIAERFRDADAPADAAKLYEKSARLFEELGGEGNALRQAKVLKAAAERRHESGDHQSALAHWHAALSLWLRRYHAAPDDPERLYLLASALANIGHGHRKAGDTDAALQHYQFGYATYKEVPAGYKNRDQYLSRDANTIRRLKTRLGQLADAEVLLPMASTWRYLAPAEPAPEEWTHRSFDDESWTEGRGQFGYGDGDEATEIEFGPDPDRKHPTVYFRRTIDIADPKSIRSIHLDLIRDDGAVVYLNGIEIARTMMPEGIVSYSTYATAFTDNDIENHPESIDPGIDPTILRSGANILAVEIHQVEAASSDLSFDLEVSINAPTEAPLEGMDQTTYDELVAGEETAGQ